MLQAGSRQAIDQADYRDDIKTFIIFAVIPESVRASWRQIHFFQTIPTGMLTSGME